MRAAIQFSLGVLTGFAIVVGVQRYDYQPESPQNFRSRIIQGALDLPGGEQRCVALGELLNAREPRECDTDMECEAMDVFNKNGCCYNDGADEPVGC